MEPNTSVIWRPQTGPQQALLECPVFEVFYGGARGGGKTDGMLGEFIGHAAKYGADAVGLMVRRERTQLVETIERSKALYIPLGAKFREQDKMWTFPNGARLRFAYLERDSDAEGYQGHSYTRVYVEEIGNFPRPEPVMKLMATLRSPKGVPVGFRATGNPGGPGHSWVKTRYIDPVPAGWQRVRDERTGLERVYIPSRIRDNEYLGDDYVQRLKASGSDALVKAWLEGDWNAIEGAFFDCWSTERHVIDPFFIPPEWTRFRAMDWGSAAPFSIGWYAIAPGDAAAVAQDRFAGGDAGHWSGDDTRGVGRGSLGPAALDHSQRPNIPRGCLVRYREWYGAGDKLTAEEVAEGIKQREEGDPAITYGVIDPSAFAQDGGPSIAERMSRVGVKWRPADNKRVTKLGALGGWDQMRARLKGDAEGNPMLVFFSTCRDAIRTIPVLQHDPEKPEDLDTEAEDHAADEVRYACMSRPFVRAEKKPEEPKWPLVGLPGGRQRTGQTIMEIIKQNARRNQRA